MQLVPNGVTVYSAIKDVGLPAVILVIFLTQLVPKIDHGISIADHVDAELQYLAVRGCAPLSLTP